MTTDKPKATEFEGNEEVLSPHVSRTAVVIGASPTNTYLGRCQADMAMDAGGRYGAVAKPTVVTGSHAYPKLPENSPWHSDPVGDEPPLNIDVDAMEPIERPKDDEPC
jgi:hypothetical protein